MSIQTDRITGTRTPSWVSSIGRGTVPGALVTAGVSGVLVTNQAYIRRIVLPTATTIRRFYWANGTTAGTNNVQVGVYNDDLTSFLLGTATLASGTTQLQFDNVTDTAIPAGRYFLVLSASGATTHVVRSSNNFHAASGLYLMASAHPLPATLVPATLGISVPVFGFTSVA